MRVAVWGPLGDHTLCAIANDLCVYARLAALKTVACRRRPAETCYPHFLGVKWSQVQILSARRSKPALTSVGAGFVLLGLRADVWQCPKRP
jgi:hypothetical protein